MPPCWTCKDVMPSIWLLCFRNCGLRRRGGPVRWADTGPKHNTRGKQVLYRRAFGGPPRAAPLIEGCWTQAQACARNRAMTNSKRICAGLPPPKRICADPAQVRRL